MWKARLEMPFCVDDRGLGRREEDFLQPYTRVRVEVKVGERGFVPLIDGPVTEVVTPRELATGAQLRHPSSTTTSVFLDQERHHRLPEQSDSEIASTVYTKC